MQVRLVDTNVLIVASAVDEGSPFRQDATPVEEAALRQQVFDWLEAFGPAENAELRAALAVARARGADIPGLTSVDFPELTPPATVMVSGTLSLARTCSTIVRPGPGTRCASASSHSWRTRADIGGGGAGGMRGSTLRGVDDDFRHAHDGGPVAVARSIGARDATDPAGIRRRRAAHAA